MNAPTSRVSKLDKPPPPGRRRLHDALAVLALVAVASAVAVIVATSGGGNAHATRNTKSSAKSHGASTPARHSSTAATPSAHTGPYGVGVRILHLVDASRTAQLPSGPAPRALMTIVRYPASISPGSQATNAPPAAGRFPLIVFGHGFAVTPSLYSLLLRAWAAAGYVVAAPVFPLENANAPGGPTEADLTNQPGDMSFLITHLLEMSAAASGPLAGLIDSAKVVVAGQSDGGDTALAVAYDNRFHDARVKAVVVLSGAEMPGVEGFEFQPGEPPLLATQGTADTVNPPELTNTFFQAAAPPKFLLTLYGAEHLPPYSRAGADLNVVEAVTIAFLDGYVKGRAGAPALIAKAGNVPGRAALTAVP